jgi:hypothetical protein
MRRILPDNYIIESSGSGYLIRFERGRNVEYLGSDGLWHRQAGHCDPFSERHVAEQKIEQEKGDRS